MPKATAFAIEVLALILNGTAIANIAQNGVTPATNTTIALHTGAGPAVAGTQATNEISYTGYARVNVSRVGTAGWTAPNASATSFPVANITFGAMTAGTGGTVTFFSVGHASVADKHLYHGAVSPTIVVSSGVTPQLTTASSLQET